MPKIAAESARLRIAYSLSIHESVVLALAIRDATDAGGMTRAERVQKAALKFAVRSGCDLTRVADLKFLKRVLAGEATREGDDGE